MDHKSRILPVDNLEIDSFNLPAIIQNSIAGHEFRSVE